MKHRNLDYEFDELSKLLEIILSRNRSSLSITDVAHLERCIALTDELKKESSQSGRKDIMNSIVLKLLELFCKPEVMEQIQNVLNQLGNLN